MRFPELEKTWLPRIHTRIKALGRFNDEDLEDAILRLSKGLTRDRKLAGTDYASRPELHAAYLDFFWAGTYAQTRIVLGLLDGPLGEVLDLGCGTGASTAALIDSGAERVHGVDWSEEALDSARAIHPRYASFEREDIMVYRAPSGQFDTVVLSHLVNELWRDESDSLQRRADLLDSLVSALRPGGRVVVLEPAMKDTSRAMLEVRDILVDRGHSIVAPCLWQSACPALADGDWCHSAWPWTPPDHVNKRSEAVGLRRDLAKTTYFVLGPNTTQFDAPTARVISTPLHSKGRLKYVVCGTEGRFGLTMQEKHLGAHNQAFRRLERGTVITYGEHVTKGDGERLGADSAVTIVASPTEPL